MLILSVLLAYYVVRRPGRSEGFAVTSSADVVPVRRLTPPVLRRFREWWANPWGKPRFLALFTVLYLVWSIVPILIAIRFSFNEGRSRSTAQGWSLRWYYEDADLSVWHDPDLRVALFQSLRLAAIAVAIAVPLGVALAIGLTRWRGRVAGDVALRLAGARS